MGSVLDIAAGILIAKFVMWLFSYGQKIQDNPDGEGIGAAIVLVGLALSVAIIAMRLFRWPEISN